MRKNEKQKNKKNNGITLIALVITIIVLLILAGVTIVTLTGDNGILTRAAEAKKKTKEAQLNEEAVLDNYEQYIEGTTNGGTLTTVTGKETTNTKVKDSLENEIIIPAGFKVVNPGDNVEDGIVIEDVSHELTKGSQFVWIPVGEIITSKGNITIDLDRYTFDENGNPTEHGDGIIYSYYQELKNSTYGNAAGKDIEEFKTSANNNGGYYIARYEARTGVERQSKEDSLTQTTVKANDYIYNFVTQLQAANQSQNMYIDSNFISDLVNSYAWDTAIVFIQKCSENKNYSRQNSLNTEVLAKTGTNNLEIKDVVCNIYDLASNCYEWTTETFMDSKNPCAGRGGSFKHR